MPLEILDPGLLTTIQDLGRFGCQHLGVPLAGAMDPFALRAANALVKNTPVAAGLEITVMGPKVLFTEGCAIAVAGADLGPRLDGRQVENWATYLVKPGTILDFAGRRSGARAYLTVSGGVAVEPWLGSRATYLMASVGGLEGRALRSGDQLPIGVSSPSVIRSSVPSDCRPPYSNEPVIRVILGPHLNRFTDDGINTFLSESYQVSASSNRMGYRLEGPKITHTRGPDVISCGIPLGGIQVPGSGKPIILLADHQTTGGYTVIASVILADIPLVAQCLPGDRLRFRPVSLEDARAAYRQQVEGLQTAIEGAEVSLWEI